MDDISKEQSDAFDDILARMEDWFKTCRINNEREIATQYELIRELVKALEAINRNTTYYVNTGIYQCSMPEGEFKEVLKILDRAKKDYDLD